MHAYPFRIFFKKIILFLARINLSRKKLGIKKIYTVYGT